jgi:hypothetical protein
MTVSESVLLYDWRFTANQFVLGPRTIRITTRIFFGRVSDVRQIEIHTAELLVPDPSPFEVEIAILKLKRYKLPELIQARK